MLYKGYRIRITNFEHIQYSYHIYLDGREIAFKGYIVSGQKALDLAQNAIDAITANPYTPNIRPPYMWISVEDDLPKDFTRVFAVWEQENGHKVISKSYIYDCFWIALDNTGLNWTDGWCVTHWQYIPALPE
jgi:hypothetical protein